MLEFQIDILICFEADHGTRVHATCARDQFDDDVWPSAESLGTKVQYIRERLGVMFRRLLSAHEDNQIAVSYHDLETNEKGSFDVVPIWLEYDDDESKKAHEFEVKISNGQRYDVQYEAGTLDIDAMTAKAGGAISGSPHAKWEIQISISTESKPARDRYLCQRAVVDDVGV